MFEGVGNHTNTNYNIDNCFLVKIAATMSIPGTKYLPKQWTQVKWHKMWRDCLLIFEKKNPVSFACFSHYIGGSYYNFNKIHLYRNKAAYQAMPLIEEHTIPRSYTNSFSIQLSCLLFALSFYANLETVPLFLWRSHDKYVRWGLLGRKL